MINRHIMTTRELAEYIKMNEKTVLKMAQQGELPGVKIGNQWRFHMDAIDQYIQTGITSLSDNDLDLIIKTADHIIPLAKLTNASLINLNLKAQNKEEVLAELATIAQEAGVTKEPAALLEQLRESENMLSTAIGQGVAIPHAKHPSQKLFKNPNILIACSKQGIDCGAPDGKDVHLFFMTCAPSEFVHIRLLAKISKMLHIPNVIEKFVNAKGSDEIIKILLNFDRMQILPSLEEGK